LKLTKTRHSIYQRIGVLKFMGCEDTAPYSKFMKAVAEYSCMVNKDDFFMVETKDDGEVQYTIVLVRENNEWTQ
jgi:hypothetical protein